MYIIKYGRLYISWVNYENYEFGVDIKEKAKVFESEAEVLELHKYLGLGNIEIERL
jgi:hypothetical protein